MTLDGYALTGLFVVMFGFLAFSAWVLERHPADPISGDRRHQAHEARRWQAHEEETTWT